MTQKQVVLGEAAGTALRLIDHGSAGRPVRVTLEVERGSLSVAAQPGLQVRPTGTLSSPAGDGEPAEETGGGTVTARSVELIGERSLVEAALDGITIRGGDDLDDQLRVTFERLAAGSEAEPAPLTLKLDLRSAEGGGPSETLTRVRPEAGGTAAGLLATGLAALTTGLQRRRHVRDRDPIEVREPAHSLRE